MLMAGDTQWAASPSSDWMSVTALLVLTTSAACYRPRYLNTQRLNYLWTIRHSSARIAGNLIT